MWPFLNFKNIRISLPWRLDNHLMPTIIQYMYFFVECSRYKEAEASWNMYSQGAIKAAMLLILGVSSILTKSIIQHKCYSDIRIVITHNILIFSPTSHHYLSLT